MYHPCSSCCAVCPVLPDGGKGKWYVINNINHDPQGFHCVGRGKLEGTPFRYGRSISWLSIKASEQNIIVSKTANVT
jgi:hypothetical protein